MNSESLGKQLRSYRAKCGFNLDTCAERSGISTRYLADIELGAKVPKLETFISILNALGASADKVLQDSLVAGYVEKSNDILKELESLDAVQKNQALDIFRYVISTFKKQ